MIFDPFGSAVRFQTAVTNGVKVTPGHLLWILQRGFRSIWPRHPGPASWRCHPGGGLRLANAAPTAPPTRPQSPRGCGTFADGRDVAASMHVVSPHGTTERGCSSGSGDRVWTVSPPAGAADAV